MPKIEHKKIEYFVDLNECHICTSHYKDRSGYPKTKINGNPISISRHLWIKEKGPIQDGFCVCHKCDNPSCINIEHLWLGTIQENLKDRDIKGRCIGPRGEKQWLNKLSKKQTLEIFSKDGTNKEIAYEYGVNPSQISRIKNGKRWGWLIKPLIKQLEV